MDAARHAAAILAVMLVEQRLKTLNLCLGYATLTFLGEVVIGSLLELLRWLTPVEVVG
jgi:hypothetical protein